MKDTLLENFWKRVDKTSYCWNWTGYINATRYGEINTPEVKHMLAHRFSYRQFVGELKPGMHIDHLCLNKLCVNPDHLEQIDKNVHGIRSATINLKRNEREYCHEGHKFTATNTTLFIQGGGRICRVCYEND